MDSATFAALMRLAVVILNWNGVELLQRFLPGVVKHSSGHEVVVIDNASTDDSKAWVQTEFPNVTWVDNPKNLGYAGGYNLGLEQVEADVYCLLNSDVEVSAGWIDPVLKAFERYPDMAACQPKLLDLKRPDHFEYAGASGGFIDRYGYPYCRGRVFDSLEADTGQYDEEMEIHWATGACFFIRAEAFKASGGLDEDLFAHMEEIDLCWRLRRAGHRIFSIPSSVVYHLGGATLSGLSPFKSYLNFRNNLIMLLKNDRSGATWRLLFIRMSMDALSFVRFITQWRGRHAWAILRAHFAFYLDFGKHLKKREALGTDHAENSDFSVVWQYFGKGRKTFAQLPSHQGSLKSPSKSL